MIFASKNEKGDPAWKLILEGKKTVTRRLKPIKEGSIRAIQQNRCGKAIGHIKIISCQSSDKWIEELLDCTTKRTLNRRLREEANREGFERWFDLCDWFLNNNIDIDRTYRIEFELIQLCPKCNYEMEKRVWNDVWYWYCKNCIHGMPVGGRNKDVL